MNTRIASGETRKARPTTTNFSFLSFINFRTAHIFVDIKRAVVAKS